MKIYILTPNSILRPEYGFIAPAHNQDYGVEQDFYDWLLAHPEYLTDNPNEADFDYLPIWYNRYYCNHWGNHSEIVQAEILRLVSRNRPTFTICEYDLASFYPAFDLCNMTVFTASRRADNGSIDIPLLCSAHQQIPCLESRRYLASFMGKFETHGIREEMRQALAGRNDVYLTESRDTRSYVELMANSEVALAPRGYGGQTFRFYEAMQFGCVPFLISDLDTRPFKQWINWDEFSFFVDKADEIEAVLSSRTREQLQQMGRQARERWTEDLYYDRWEKFLIWTLQGLS